MSKVAHYLQEHLLGEVTTSTDARRYFATDNSIFSLPPSIIVYPRNENDVRKTARFAWQLAERGRIIPITPRGAGTDVSGGALGNGIMMVFPAHMNRIIELDQKSGVVVVEPGLNYGRLQQTLHTHDRFLPPFPASLEYSTIGGAVGNNASGQKSVKYGATKDYTRSLRVVLANGEVIETRRLAKRDLSKKLGLTTFEGEIYRSLDALIEESKDLIDKIASKDVLKNTAGYAITDIKRKDGSFDLTPLFVGSQGTLGIISEITCETEAYNPETVVFAAFFKDIASACKTIQLLRALPQMPSSIEFVDGHLLDIVRELNPNQLKGLVPDTTPAAALIVELDDADNRQHKKTIKHAQKLFDEHALEYKEESEPEAQAGLWKIRQASATLLAHSDKQLKPVPIVEDGIVPVSKLEEFIQGIYMIFKSLKLDVALWGPAGEGNIHVHPFLDLAQLGERQKAFRLMDEYYRLVMNLGGSSSGKHNDGRIRGTYLPQVYGQDVYELFQKVKQIFDPYGTLNPGVKVNVSMDEIRPLLRSSYSLDHLYNHMPRS